MAPAVSVDYRVQQRAYVERGCQPEREGDAAARLCRIPIWSLAMRMESILSLPPIRSCISVSAGSARAAAFTCRTRLRHAITVSPSPATARAAARP